MRLVGRISANAYAMEDMIEQPAPTSVTGTSYQRLATPGWEGRSERTRLLASVGTCDTRPESNLRVPMTTIDNLIEQHRHAELDRQPIAWNRAMWEKVWQDDDLPGHKALDAIDAEYRAHDTVRRSWLRELSDGDPVAFLVASTIWGYGNFGRGIKALRTMLQSREGSDVAETTADIIEASRRSPEAGFGSLFQGGKPRMPWLGIAYGTKVVHFAGYDHTQPPPLILDKRVWIGARALDTETPVPDPATHTTSAEYGEYCSWASSVADRHGVTPQHVEYALFTHGGSVRAAARR